MSRPSLINLGVSAAFFLAGMVGVVLPYVLPGVLPGDIGDARLNRFFLEHFFQVITGDAESFTDAPFFYPWINTIALSDTLWGTAPLYALFRFLHFDPERAFAAWFVVGFVLNYVSAYVVLRWFGLKGLGASAGAFLFSFGLPVMAQDSHAQLFHRYCVPWAVWALYRYSETRDVRHLALAGLFVAFQLLMSFYIGTFLALLLTAYTIVLLFERNSFASAAALKDTLRSALPKMPMQRGSVLTVVILTCATLAILLLVALPYLEVVRLYHLKRDWAEISEMLPRASSYFQARRSYFWSWLSSYLGPLPMAHEHQIFFGFVPLACLGIAVFRRRQIAADNRLVRQSCYALALLWALTLSVSGFSLYAILAPLPGLSAVRGMTRIAMVLIFPLALIMGSVVDGGWEKRSSRPYLGGLILIACLFLVLEATLIKRSTSTIKEWDLRIEALRAETTAKIGARSIIVVNQEKKFKQLRELDAMLLAQSLRATTMNGHSGNYPPLWTPMHTCADVVAMMQKATMFRKRHREPGFRMDTARIVPIGFGDCSEEFARADRDQTKAYTLGSHLKFCKSCNGSSVMTGGWASPETWGTWTEGNYATLEIPLPEKLPDRLQLAVRVNAVRNTQPQLIGVFVNEKKIGDWQISSQGSVTRCLTILKATALLRNPMHLAFHIYRPIAPSSIGRSKDNRLLGMGLQGLEIRPMDSSLDKNVGCSD